MLKEVLSIFRPLLCRQRRLEPEAEKPSLLCVLPALHVDQEHPELEVEVAGLLLAVLLHLLVDHDALMLPP